MTHAAYAVTVYRNGDGWVYDDLRLGLVREPLGEASTFVDWVVGFEGLNIDGPLALLFSDQQYGGYRCMGIREEAGGSIYALMNNEEFWVGPQLLSYFDSPPPTLYVKVCSLDEALSFLRPPDFRLTDDGTDEDGETRWLLSPLNSEAAEWLEEALRNVGDEITDEEEHDGEQIGNIAGRGLMLLLTASALAEGWKIQA